MYIGEQYRIVDDQAIEFIGFWRTVADEGELIIWPSQG
jgi:preprotein translocase subunit SecE